LKRGDITDTLSLLLAWAELILPSEYKARSMTPWPCTAELGRTARRIENRSRIAKDAG